LKTIILAGGFGTRMSEYTELVPKPMIEIGQKPILWHIMRMYSHFGYKDFCVALGYKAEIIKKYFLDYHLNNVDFSIDLSSGKTETLKQFSENWNINLIDTGLNTMTGGRLKRLKEYIDPDQPFLMTYGDGVSNVDINKLVEFHKSHQKLVTMTAVRPPARFGELDLKNGKVNSFIEKPQLDQGWINGGFFVIEPKFLEYIEGDEIMLEREPLEKATEEGELMAFEHEGFWQCMDTKRDYQFLEKLWSNDEAPWKK
tara:strand:- start:9378 stop:10145 length:768 start_codon:yes stop_codon:yes gene_type:complete